MNFMKKLTNGFRNDSLKLFILAALYRIRFSGARLSICKNGGMISFYNAIDEADSFNAFINLFLLCIGSEYAIEFENFLSLLCELHSN